MIVAELVIRVHRGGEEKRREGRWALSFGSKLTIKLGLEKTIPGRLSLKTTYQEKL